MIQLFLSFSLSFSLSASPHSHTYTYTHTQTHTDRSIHTTEPHNPAVLMDHIHRATLLIVSSFSSFTLHLLFSVNAHTHTHTHTHTYTKHKAHSTQLNGVELLTLTSFSHKDISAQCDTLPLSTSSSSPTPSSLSSPSPSLHRCPLISRRFPLWCC